MVSIERSIAEKKFASLEKRNKALSELEEAARLVDENTARLKALRLAKEEKDRLMADVSKAALPKRRSPA